MVSETEEKNINPFPPLECIYVEGMRQRKLYFLGGEKPKKTNETLVSCERPIHPQPLPAMLLAMFCSSMTL